MKTKSHTPIAIHLSLIALFVLCIISCSGNLPTPREVAQKIDDKETLTTDDYTTMIDYCGDYAKRAQKYYDIINAEPNDSTEAAIKATGDLATLYGSCQYLDLFRSTLANTDLSALGKDNEKKVNEYAKYQGFPLPIGEGADLQDPNVVGMIEQMPDTAVSESAGVISTGDGEAVDITAN